MQHHTLDPLCPVHGDKAQLDPKTISKPDPSGGKRSGGRNFLQPLSPVELCRRHIESAGRDDPVNKLDYNTPHLFYTRNHF